MRDHFVAFPPRFSFTIALVTHRHAKQESPMPNRCPPNQKRRALEPLDLDDNNLSIAQGLTGIPPPTRHDWRKQRLPDNLALSGAKKFPFPENIREKTKRFPRITPHPLPPKPHYTHTVSIPFRDLRDFKGHLRGFAETLHGFAMFIGALWGFTEALRSFTD